MKKVVKIEQPFAKFGKWEVYQDGTLKGIYVTPSGRESTVHIYPERLVEPDLLISMMADRVADEWNFLMPAFLTACRLAGIKSIPNFQTDFE
jgi:hypothetical protein